MWTSFAESLPIMVKHNSGSREWPLPLWEKGLFFFSGGQSSPGGVQPGLGSRKSTGTTANQNSSFGPTASCPGKSYPCLQNTSGTCSLYLAGCSEDPVRLYFRWLEKSVLLDTAFLHQKIWEPKWNSKSKLKFLLHTRNKQREKNFNTQH